MSQIIILPQKTSTEALTFNFSFANVLDINEDITSVVMTATVLSGVDPDPSAVLGDGPLFTTTDVFVNVKDGISGVIYLITCDARTEFGPNFYHHIMTGKLAVVDGGF